jgi:hypothetical protein
VISELDHHRDGFTRIHGARLSTRTGEQRYRDAVVKALRSLPKYTRHVWDRVRAIRS